MSQKQTGVRALEPLAGGLELSGAAASIACWSEQASLAGQTTPYGTSARARNLAAPFNPR